METLAMEWGSVSDWVNVSLTGLCVLGTIWATIIAQRAQRSAENANKKHLEITAGFFSHLLHGPDGEPRSENWQLCVTVINHGIKLYISQVYLFYDKGEGRIGHIGIFHAENEYLSGQPYGAIEPNDQWRGRTMRQNEGEQSWDGFIHGTKAVVQTRCGYKAECVIDEPLVQMLQKPKRDDFLKQALEETRKESEALKASAQTPSSPSPFPTAKPR